MSGTDFTKQEALKAMKQYMAGYYQSSGTQAVPNPQLGQLNATKTQATLPDGTVVAVTCQGNPDQYAFVFQNGITPAIAWWPTTNFINVDGTTNPIRFLYGTNLCPTLGALKNTSEDPYNTLIPQNEVPVPQFYIYDFALDDYYYLNDPDFLQVTDGMYPQIFINTDPFTSTSSFAGSSVLLSPTAAPPDDNVSGGESGSSSETFTTTSNTYIAGSCYYKGFLNKTGTNLLVVRIELVNPNVVSLSTPEGGGSSSVAMTDSSPFQSCSVDVSTSGTTSKQTQFYAGSHTYSVSWKNYNGINLTTDPLTQKKVINFSSSPVQTIEINFSYTDTMPDFVISEDSDVTIQINPSFTFYRPDPFHPGNFLTSGVSSTTKIPETTSTNFSLTDKTDTLTYFSLLPIVEYLSNGYFNLSLVGGFYATQYGILETTIDVSANGPVSGILGDDSGGSTAQSSSVVNYDFITDRPPIFSGVVTSGFPIATGFFYYKNINTVQGLPEPKIFKTSDYPDLASANISPQLTFSYNPIAPASIFTDSLFSEYSQLTGFFQDSFVSQISQTISDLNNYLRIPLEWYSNTYAVQTDSNIGMILNNILPLNSIPTIFETIGLPTPPYAPIYVLNDVVVKATDWNGDYNTTTIFNASSYYFENNDQNSFLYTNTLYAPFKINSGTFSSLGTQSTTSIGASSFSLFTINPDTTTPGNLLYSSKAPTLQTTKFLGNNYFTTGNQYDSRYLDQNPKLSLAGPAAIGTDYYDLLCDFTF